MNMPASGSLSVIAHVRMLVVTILIFALCVISLILWQVNEHHKTNDVLLNYYTHSAQNISAIDFEVLKIKNAYHQLSSAQVSGHTEDLVKYNHDIIQSQHIARRAMLQIQSIQVKNQNSSLELVIARLQTQMNLVLPLFNMDIGEKIAQNKLHLLKIDAVLLTLSQLERLYSITAQELTKQANLQEKNRIKFILFFLILALGIGGYITYRTIATIKMILQEQENTQARLFEEKDLVHTTLISIGDAVITTDSAGIVTALNPVAERLTGWSNKDAQGQSVKIIFPIIDATTGKPVENPVDKVIATGGTVYLSNHTTLISKDGTEFQIADSAAPIRKKDGVILGMVLIFNDVTEQYQLRQSAAKSKRDLQAIMDNSPAAIYVADLSGRFTFINRRTEKLLKTQCEHIIGKTHYDVFPQETAEAMNRGDIAALDAGRPLEQEELIPEEDDAHHYITIRFPLLDDSGNAYAICAISTDITERKIQEEYLHRTQKMDALGKLTSGIAHDYNNVLGIIVGYAEQLHSHLASDTKLEKCALEIQHAAERGAKLTKQLLSFSQNNTQDYAVLDINELLKNQRLMMEKTLTVRIRLNFNLAVDLWSVCLDRSELENAILNLCINAMHAMNDGGQLSIQTRNVKVSESDAKTLYIPDGDYVLLTVTDTGCGMDADTRHKIFDPFFSTKGEHGTGLGLSQVHGFVERSGGSITVFSERGQGSSFTLYFPRSRKIPAQVKAAIGSGMEKLHGRESLLVVDDEQAIVELACDILTARDYRVLTANNGEQALKILKREHVDLMITDVIMPNMDGYQLVALVRQYYPQVKIQLSTGFADNRHQSAEDEVLNKNILYKPYTSTALLKHVRDLLDTEVEIPTLAGRTILVMDDDEEARNLFSINLAKLDCKTIAAQDGEQAVTFYRQSMESGESIDAVIMDLSIPGGMGGKEVVGRILAMDPRAKMIVASGYSQGPEMTHFEDFGFQGALEKDFNRENIKQVLERVLSLH